MTNQVSPEAKEAAVSERTVIGWRVQICKPDRHDGAWGWVLEWRDGSSPRPADSDDDGWCDRFPPVPYAHATRGRADNHFAAKRDAADAKAWWKSQFAHEARPSVFTESLP